MSDLELLSYYLGIQVTQGDGFMELKQTAYANKILEKAGMAGCNPMKYLMDPKLVLTKDPEGSAVNSNEYKSLVGDLRYLVHRRPDIAFSVGVVSHYMERHTVLHLNVIKRVLRYIKGTINYGLIYKKDSGNKELIGYSESDFAGHINDRRSTGGVVFYLNESVIPWVS